ncbi:MAG: FkbM family methyltransferase [Tabrizicola sp.]|uniref:FkbM family methyltransferase n=1 Tax=Tabrizicola sp. TaxID=2005166 RepID=UPI002AB90466|nr:FkbM family methyltransferase [Tabrizicola sp.]MDZ4089373.1 FkbM family methyltransferase [Tabrizicola sp.]
MNDEILFLISEGLYELPEITGISRTVRPGDRVLELGAGLGIISAFAARAAGPTGKVRSYEANPVLIQDTRAFLASNMIDSVDLVNAILVAEEDPHPRHLHLAGSFAESSLLGAEGRNPQGTVEVPAASLFAVLADFRPDVLICDIEGAEVELLPALPPSSLRAAVVELHPDRLTPTQIQSIHDGMSAQGLHRQEPSPGGTVEIYSRSSRP